MAGLTEGGSHFFSSKTLEGIMIMVCVCTLYPAGALYLDSLDKLLGKFSALNDSWKIFSSQLYAALLKLTKK